MFRDFGSEVGYVDEIGYDADTGQPVNVKRRADVAIRTDYDSGKMRVGVMPVTANLTLAAAGVGNLVFTPNRTIEIVDLVIDTYVAAAAAAAHAPGAIHITAITVQGRNLLPGTGFIPIRAFYHDRVQRYNPFLFLGAIDANQNCTISLINNDAATAHNVTATIGCIFAD